MDSFTKYKSPWSEEDCKIIRDNHGRKTLPQIYRMISKQDITYSGFRSKCQRMGLYRDKRIVKIPLKECNFHNEDYFENLTLENCWLAGLICSDGCIMLDRYNTFRFLIKLAIKDEELITATKRLLNYNARTKYCSNKSPHSDKICKMAHISVSCFDRNAEYLEQHFNIIQGKTHRLVKPNLNDINLILSYIIGFIDGDGTVSIAKSRKYNTLYIGACSISKPILEWIKSVFDAKFLPSVSLCKYKRIAGISMQKKDNVYKYYISGLRAAVIINYLSQFPVPKLARKWQNPQVWARINDYKEKYPELFDDSPSQIENNDVK
jgi:hypothetical protein